MKKNERATKQRTGVWIIILTNTVNLLLLSYVSWELESDFLKCNLPNISTFIHLSYAFGGLYALLMLFLIRKLNRHHNKDSSCANSNQSDADREEPLQ
jgi:hypothetical protein